MLTITLSVLTILLFRNNILNGVLIGIYILLLPGLEFYLIIRRNNTCIIDLAIISILISFYINIITAYILSIINIPLTIENIITSITLLNILFTIILILSGELKKTLTKKISLTCIKDEKILIIATVALSMSLMNFIPLDMKNLDSIKKLYFHPGGDDSKHHLLLIKDLATSKQIPIKDGIFGYINPIYPLGSHIIMYEVTEIFSLKPGTAIMICNLMFVTIQLFSLYTFLKNIDKKNVLSLFIVISVSNLILFKESGWYQIPEMLAVSFFLISLKFLNENRDFISFMFSSAASLTNTYVGIVSVMSIFLFNLTKSHKNPMKIFFKLLIACLLITILSLPYLIIIYRSKNIHADYENKNIKDIIVNSEKTKIKALLSFYKNKDLLKLPYIKDYGTTKLLSVLFIALYVSNINKITDKKTKHILYTIFLGAILLIILSLIAETMLLNFSQVYTNILITSRIFSIKRFLYFIYLTSLISASTVLINRKNGKKILLTIMIISTIIRLYPPVELKRIFYTEAEKDYIEFVKYNLTYKNNTWILNDWTLSTPTTWIYPETGKKTYCIYAFLNDIDKIRCTSGSKIEFLSRVIPDSKIALSEFKKKNIKYITFSSRVNWKKYELPVFDLSKFDTNPYKKLYSKDGLYIFEITSYSSASPYILVKSWNHTELFRKSSETIYNLKSDKKIYYNKSFVRLKNVEITIPLSDLSLANSIPKSIEPYVFIWYIPDGLATNIEYVLSYEDIYNYTFSQRVFKESYENVSILPIKLPQMTLSNGYNKLILRFIGNKIDIKNISLYMRLPPSSRKIGDDSYILPNKNGNRTIIFVKNLNNIKDLLIVANDTKFRFGHAEICYKTRINKICLNSTKSYVCGSCGIKAFRWNIMKNFSAALIDVDIHPENIIKIVKISKDSKIIISRGSSETLSNTFEPLSSEFLLTRDWNKISDNRYTMFKSGLNYKIYINNTCSKISINLNCTKCIDVNIMDSKSWKNILSFKNQTSKNIRFIFIQNKPLVIGVYPYNDTLLTLNFSTCIR